jgi:hypothetical protein
MDEKLRAGLGHIETCGDLQSFDGTKLEKNALIATAIKRRLIVWDKKQAKYELTATARRRLATPTGGIAARLNGVPTFKLIGAALGLAALAGAWSYVDAVHRPFSGPTSAAATPVVEPAPTAAPVVVEKAKEAPFGLASADARPVRLATQVETPAAPSNPPAPPAAVAPVAVAPPAAATPPTPVVGTEQPPATPPAAVEQDAAAAPPVQETGKTSHRPRHAGRHHRRETRIDRTVADIDRFARNLFSSLTPPPNHRRR